MHEIGKNVLYLAMHLFFFLSPHHALVYQFCLSHRNKLHISISLNGFLHLYEANIPVNISDPVAPFHMIRKCCTQWRLSAEDAIEAFEVSMIIYLHLM